MKTHQSRRQDGFTLVELLVVIAIIAVLAGAGFAAAASAIQRAKKTTALASCAALESAVNNFYTEYGTMPNTAAMTTDTKVDTKDDVINFLNPLLGLEAGTTPINTRTIKFLNVKEGKLKGANDGINGLVYNAAGSTVIGLFDPWGGTYKVMLDGDYDEKLDKVQPKGAKKEVILNSRRAAAWSDGADGATKATNGEATDDVTTWK
ncbi:MAG: prepilin-type N-terminal cleavage/methylation domain-containing protein [Luteolibacter sp.]